MNEADRLLPDIHIFTASKQLRVVQPTGMPAVEEFYDRRQCWPRDSLERRRALLG